MYVLCTARIKRFKTGTCHFVKRAEKFSESETTCTTWANIEISFLKTKSGHEYFRDHKIFRDNQVSSAEAKIGC